MKPKGRAMVLNPNGNTRSEAIITRNPKGTRSAVENPHIDVEAKIESLVALRPYRDVTVKTEPAAMLNQ